MNNEQQNYSYISTCATETCCKGPIVIAGTGIFIDANAKSYNIRAELLDMQLRLYEDITGGTMRYVDGHLVQHYNAGKRHSRRRSFIQIAGALSKEEIDERVRSLSHSKE